MTKRHWKDPIKAYIDPEQDEEAKKAKIDLDDRVANFSKLIQHKNKSKKGGRPIFDSELIELVDDFHKKYQTLYALYEHLKGQVLENIYYKDDEDKSSSSSNSFHSSSELEPYNSVEQFEEMKNECSRLRARLVDKEKKLSNQRRSIEELEMLSNQREEKLSDILIKLEENEIDLMSKSKDLMEKANELQLEVDAFWSEKDFVSQGGEIMHKSNSESFLSKLNQESSGYLFQLEILKAKFERKNTDLQKILEEKKGLERKVKNFENLVKGKIFEDADFGKENEGLRVKVSELEELLNERNNDVFVLEAEYEFLEHGSSTHIKELGEEIMSLQEELNEKDDNLIKLMHKLEDFEKTMVDKEEIISKKNEILCGLNSMETNFQECNIRFSNKMYMLSDKVMLAKDWAKIKNEMIHEKESEIIWLKERVWKLENDMREKEEGILGLGEEKMEAIRQLCVWAEYHRGQNDNLKKILSDLHDFRSLRSS